MAWSFLMLLLVVALIPLALWGVKRLQTVAASGGARHLELIAQMPLGPRERVVMVRVQDRILVLGATGAQVSLLTELAPGSIPPADPKTGHAFANVLQSLQSGAKR